MKITKMADFMAPLQEKFPRLPARTLSQIVREGSYRIRETIVRDDREVLLQSQRLGILFLVYKYQRRPAPQPDRTDTHATDPQ